MNSTKNLLYNSLRSFSIHHPNLLPLTSNHPDLIPSPTQTPNLPPFNQLTTHSDQLDQPDFNYHDPDPKPIIYKDYSSGPSAIDKAAKLFFLTEIARGMWIVLGQMFRPPYTIM